MDHYADSSFLVSCYVADAHTPEATAYLAKLGAALPFTGLHALEVRNAFQLGVFRGLITQFQAESAWADVQADLRARRLIRTALKWPIVLRGASLLTKRYSSTTGTRSIDVLHVAAARSLRCAEFISFDSRQNMLALNLDLKLALRGAP